MIPFGIRTGQRALPERELGMAKLAYENQALRAATTTTPRITRQDGPLGLSNDTMELHQSQESSITAYNGDRESSAEPSPLKSNLAKAQKLPNELLGLIFSNLDDVDKNKIALLNSDWYHFARQEQLKSMSDTCNNKLTTIVLCEFTTKANDNTYRLIAGHRNLNTMPQQFDRPISPKETANTYGENIGIKYLIGGSQDTMNKARKSIVSEELLAREDIRQPGLVEILNFDNSKVPQVAGHKNLFRSGIGSAEREFDLYRLSDEALDFVKDPNVQKILSQRTDLKPDERTLLEWLKNGGDPSLQDNGEA